MGLITDKQVRALKDGQEQNEPLGRNRGSWFVRKRNNSTVAFYRYFHKKKKHKISLGTFKPSSGKPGLTVKELRQKAVDLADLHQQITPKDLKTHLEEQALLKARQEEEEQRKGSLHDLLSAYIDDLKKRGRSKAREYNRIFKHDVTTPFPGLIERKANAITADDIVSILARVHQRGSEVQANIVRAALHAAFNFGIKSDYDHTRVGEKRFHLTHNPVSLTKKNTSVERSAVRVLTHEELHELWHGIASVPWVGMLGSLLVQFLIATAGQRPRQLLTAKWKDYDLKRRCVTFMNHKRNGKSLPHTIPLTPRAIAILEKIRPYTGGYPWPFATSDDSHMHPDSLTKVFNRWHNYRLQQHKLNPSQPPPEKYTAKSIRDTAKSLMIDAGVDRETRNLIQSHQLTGVDYEHYDRHEHLPEKRAGIAKYDKLLNSLINGEELTVVQFQDYRCEPETQAG